MKSFPRIPMGWMFAFAMLVLSCAWAGAQGTAAPSGDVQMPVPTIIRLSPTPEETPEIEPGAGATETIRKAIETCVTDSEKSISRDEILYYMVNPSEQPSVDMRPPLRSYLECLHFNDPKAVMCDPEAIFKNSPFTTDPAKSLATLDDKQKKAVSAAFADMKNTCFINTVQPLFMKRESASNINLADYSCAFAPEKNRESCKKNINIFIEAVNKKDASMCGSINKAEAPGMQDVCQLWTRQDPALCKTKDFMKPLSYEECVDSLTAFRKLRHDPAAVYDRFLLPDGVFSVVAQADLDPDACSKIIPKRIAPPFCAWKGAKFGAPKLIIMTEEEVKQALIDREKKIKFDEELAKIRAEEQKRAKEMKEQEEALKNQPAAEKKDTGPTGDPSPETNPQTIAPSEPSGAKTQPAVAPKTTTPATATTTIKPTAKPKPKPATPR